MHPVLFHIGAIIVPAYGATAALGVLLALFLAQRTARVVSLDRNKIWNLCVVVLFTALVGSRLLLILVNWTVLRKHPLWMLGLGMVHHPLLGAVGAAIAICVVIIYARRLRLPILDVADALAAPVALGLGVEQIGALLAGSGYGTGATVPWAITYTDPLAERWSGAAIDIPVHPVQAYAALAFFLICLALVKVLPLRTQHGDVFGVFVLATGSAIFITEFWRDPVGRGSLLHGVLRAPQAAAVLLVLAGSALLLEHKSLRITAPGTTDQTQQVEGGARV